MTKPHQASKSLRRYPSPNPTRVDIGNSIDSTSTDDQFRIGTISQHNDQLSVAHICLHSFNQRIHQKLACPALSLNVSIIIAKETEITSTHPLVSSWRVLDVVEFATDHQALLSTLSLFAHPFPIP